MISFIFNPMSYLRAITEELQITIQYGEIPKKWHFCYKMTFSPYTGVASINDTMSILMTLRYAPATTGTNSTKFTEYLENDRE